LYTVGFAYAMGVVFAISLCAATSGGHFNPAVTLSSVIFREFPVRKAARFVIITMPLNIADAFLRYIFAQVLAGYLTCLIVYVQWKDLLVVRKISKYAQFSAILLSKGCGESFD
jgi:glycerol uptake facilitator-like aquaporin